MHTPTRPELETLSDRFMPSATPLYLTSDGATSDQGGFVVQQVDAQPTGTGYIQSFLRVQGAASGGGGEQGYNTDARPLQFDENKSPQFTRSFTVGDVPVVTQNGVRYREFLLDVNQKSSASKLSLDEVRIFVAGAGNLRATAAEAAGGVQTFQGAAPKFNLDANGDVAVILDARLNSGSGSGDMVLLVPDENFRGTSIDSFIYLYSKFGGEAGATANGGFEEWAVRSTGTPVAPPSDENNSGSVGTSSLSGRVFLDGSGQGIADVWVHLSGRDIYGNNVDLVTRTDADGFYKFSDLQAGTYSVWEEQPEGYADGQDFVGSIDGVEVGALDGSDRIGYIFLDAGKEGIDYNFSETEVRTE